MRRLCYLAIFLAFAFPLPGAEVRTLSQGNVHIHFDADDEASAQRVAGVSASFLAEMNPMLPLGAEPVNVRLVTTMEEFARLAGPLGLANVSGIAQANRGLILLKSPRLRSVTEDFDGTVRHELVHVLLYRNTDTQQLPRWLNEGIAMMLANEYRWQSMLQVARMALTFRLIPIAELDRAFATPGLEMAFGNAYAQGLSMTRHLREELGEENFWAVVRGTRERTFDESLAHFGGITRDEFWAGYRNSLWLIALVGTLATGSFFGPAAVLAIVAYWRVRHRNRRILRKWTEDESEEESPEYQWPPY